MVENLEPQTPGRFDLVANIEVLRDHAGPSSKLAALGDLCRGKNEPWVKVSRLKVRRSVDKASMSCLFRLPNNI